MRRALLFFWIAALFAGWVASATAAGGPPLQNEDGGLQGIATPTGFRYVAIGEPNRTILARIGPKQRVAAVRSLPGRFTIPEVAYDQTTAGLSADTRTLVLIEPRFAFPRARTSFLIISLPGLHVRSVVTLRGDFSFDAISPDGSSLYFIEYLSPTDPTSYAVRVYDAPSGTLVREPIVDRAEPDEDMRGNPITRVSSADGRWAYTLYDGAGMVPFLHALDTVGRKAHCIDLDALAGRDDLYQLRLRLTGGALAVVNGSERLAAIDTASLRLRKTTLKPKGSDEGASWHAIAAVAGAVGAAAISLLLLRRRKLALG